MKNLGYSFNIKKSGATGMLTLLTAFFMLTSCSFDPIDKTYSKHSAEDDYKRIREISDIDTADAILLGKFMVEHGLAGPNILEFHATYKDILNEARLEKERNETELKRKKVQNNEIDVARSHEKEKIKQLQKILLVDFVKEEEQDEELEAILPKKGQKPAPVVNKNLISFDVMFKNISSKDIRAFKGYINFYDIFNSELKKITFTSLSEIPAGESIVQRFTLDLNEINKSNVAYKNLKKEDIKVEWLPERLIHTDNTVIE